MGIHFVCHLCSYALHVKDFQAGKRGKCPNCGGAFRIPNSDASYSLALEEAKENPEVEKVKAAFHKVRNAKVKTHTKKSSGSISIALEPVRAVSKEPAQVPLQAKESQLDKKLPAAFAEPVNAKWFVRPPSGGQFGPAPSDMLVNWIQQSRVTADSFLWREGMSHWQLASELAPELFPTKQSATIALASPSLPPSPLPAEETVQLNTPSQETLPAVRSGAILKKRIQKRRRQLNLVILLATVSLVLLCILVFVLVFQVSRPLKVAEAVKGLLI